jgi:hypothetical protein
MNILTKINGKNMKAIDKHMAIFVLTGRGIETILAEGGSQAWAIDANRVLLR